MARRREIACSAARQTSVLLCAAFIVLGTSLSQAQQFKSTVTLNISQLPQEKQKRVESLQETVRDYIENSEWTEEQYEFEVPFTLTMTLQDMSETYEDRYSAQMQVSNQRDMQHTDKYCRFPYQVNDQLYRDDASYDPLTGLIDFYVYMALGVEMDKRARLGGTPYYQKAERICTDAGFGQDEFYTGWDTRKELVEKALADDMQTYRILQYVFFKARLMYTQGEENKARQYTRVVVQELGKMAEADQADLRIKDFFKYHYFEIVAMFKDTENQALFEKLIELDPDHRDDYQQNMK